MLTYFDYPSIGESIRLTLRLGKTEIDDVRISQDTTEAMRLKGELRSGQLP